MRLAQHVWEPRPVSRRLSCLGDSNTSSTRKSSCALIVPEPLVGLPKIKMPTILIGADLCPIGANQRYFTEGDAKSLFNDLLKDFEAADLVIANLECPLVDKRTPISKTGPSFGEPSTCING